MWPEASEDLLTIHNGPRKNEGIAAIQFHYDLEIDYDTVIDMFAMKRPRQMALQTYYDGAS